MSARALVADPEVVSSGQLRRFLESAGFRVSVAHFLDDALERLQMEPVDVFFAVASAQFDGETLCRRAKRLKPRCPVVLVYARDEEDLGTNAAKAMADGYLVEPLKKGTVVSCARSMLKIRELVDEIDRFAGKPEASSAAAVRASSDLMFFKRFLLLEVKRSRRYRIPVSFLLVGLDRFAQAELTAKERALVPALALTAISRGLREIDLCVPAGADQFIVFLPHTPRAGAITVAERIRGRVLKVKPLAACGVSVGASCYEGGADRTPPSFGALMRDATDALKRARASGGGKVEAAGERAKRDRIVMG